MIEAREWANNEAFICSALHCDNENIIRGKNASLLECEDEIIIKYLALYLLSEITSTHLKRVKHKKRSVCVCMSVCSAGTELLFWYLEIRQWQTLTESSAWNLLDTNTQPWTHTCSKIQQDLIFIKFPHITTKLKMNSEYSYIQTKSLIAVAIC